MRKKFKHFTPAEIEIIRGKLEQGQTAVEVAADLGKCLSAVRFQAKKAGISLCRVKPLTEQEKVTIKRGLEDGMTVKQLAKKTGKTAAQIYYYGKKIGIIFDKGTDKMKRDPEIEQAVSESLDRLLFDFKQGTYITPGKSGHKRRSRMDNFKDA